MNRQNLCAHSLTLLAKSTLNMRTMSQVVEIRFYLQVKLSRTESSKTANLMWQLALGSNEPCASISIRPLFEIICFDI